jgi:type III secretion protein N (ATPase)
MSHQSQISPVMPEFEVKVGDALTGRVLDALGKPMDGGKLLDLKERYPAVAMPPDPMKRPVIADPFTLGVRAIDGPLTCGVGQRVGIFAAAGGGKSTLMSMLVKFAECDRCVIALIGERGREVREFVEHSLGEAGMAKSVLIVATSDRPAIEQVKAAYTATAVAEYFRDKGEKVLLLMDSLTRFARAQRQIGLAAGEPPTRRGFPPSVFEKLPSLLERGGMTENGSITAFYTVLVEGDDMNEPVADEVRSLLDGHIILSRKLAASGHYPAIDVSASASRILNAITTKDHQSAILKMRALLSKYDEIELLVRIGEYAKGSDPLADEAIAAKNKMDAFLRQDTDDFSSFDETISHLKKAVNHA